MPHKRPNIRLIEVSEARKEFLARWRFERQIAKTLAAEAPTCATPDPAGIPLKPRDFDKAVHVGDIRLLPADQTGLSNRLLYVAVIHCRDNGTALVAPFSEYGTPCCKDEWLTGIASRPLRVLQFWNALPVPIITLAQSWKTGDLTPAQLTDARERYQHALRGTFPKGELREQVGLAILDPSDDRLVYQREELAAMSRLQHAFFTFVEKQLQAFPNIAEFLKRWPSDGALRMTAASGELHSPVVVLDSNRPPVYLRAQCADDTDDLTMEWKITPLESAECSSPTKDVQLLPGLPAQLHYKAGRATRTVHGWTTLDGQRVSFDLDSKDDKDPLRLSCESGDTRIGILRAGKL